MSLISLARKSLGFHRRLADRLHGDNVVFVHIPKCGGTSISHALRVAYFLSNSQLEAVESRRAVELLTGTTDDREFWDTVPKYRTYLAYYFLTRRSKCIVGHFHFENRMYDQFGNDYKFITVLRNPVDRFVSNFFYTEHDHKDEDEAGVPLADFLETYWAREYGSMMTRYLCGFPLGVDFTSDEAVSAAKENLERFAVIGFLDRLDEFQADLREKLGARINIIHSNKGRTRKQQSDPIDPALMERIRELCAPDQAVFDHARALVDKRRAAKS